MEAAAGRRACVLAALAGALAVWAWQAATVHFNYGGNWTALFCTGSASPAPKELAAGTYVFPNSTGYDGAYYRYMAHDPWFRKDWEASFDNRVWRYRLILVPALAWTLALGRDAGIDAAYEAVVLISVFGGVYWLGRYAASRGRRAAWGIGFVALPATLVSMDRMTVDVTLVALCAGFLWYEKRGAAGRMWVVLMLAALARETGMLLVGAECIESARRRQWGRAAAMAAAALPAVAWYAWISVAMPRAAGRHEEIRQAWFFREPVAGIFARIAHPVRYPFPPMTERLIQAVDMAALCGMVLALGLAAWRLWRRETGVEAWTCLLFLGLFVLASGQGFWTSAYGYGRPFTPLFLVLALGAMREKRLLGAAPAALVDARVLLQLTPQALGIAAGVWRALRGL